MESSGLLFAPCYLRNKQEVNLVFLVLATFLHDVSMTSQFVLLTQFFVVDLAGITWIL